jgi:hypothetical protein
MLGHGQSLSAGIVYAHFKDHLGALVAEAERLVDSDAKSLPGKGAVALAWRSRGGEKLRFVMPWKAPEPGSTEPSGAEGPPRPLPQCWERVTRAFADGVLAGGLPYKLREHGTVASAIAEAESTPGAMGSQLSTPVPSAEVLGRLLGDDVHKDDLSADVVALWQAGFRQASRVERATDGLAICRALAAEIWEGSPK